MEAIGKAVVDITLFHRGEWHEATIKEVLYIPKVGKHLMSSSKRYRHFHNTAEV